MRVVSALAARLALALIFLSSAHVFAAPASAPASNGLAIAAKNNIVALARLQRIIRSAANARASNPRNLPVYTGATLTDAGTSAPSQCSNIYLTNGVSRGVFHVVGGAYGTGGIASGYISAGSPALTYNRADFMADARYVCLRLQSTTAPYRVMVDGRQVPPATPASSMLNTFVTSQTTGSTYLLLDLGARAIHQITVDAQQNGYLLGAYTDGAGKLWAVDLSDAVHAGFLGDSFVVGAAPGFNADGVCPQLGDRVGQYIMCSGSGGTGFNQTNQTVFRFDQRTVNGDLALGYYKPDVIYFMASVNDAKVTQNFTVVQANALTAFQSARAQFPGIPIIVFGCQSTPGNQSTYTAQTEAAVQAAVTQAQATDPLIAFVPVYNDNGGAWISGVGSQILFSAPLSAATSGTLATAWANSSGTFTILFSDGSTRSVTLTQGSTAVSWTGAVTATAAAAAYTGPIANSTWTTNQDFTHPTLEGAQYIGQRYAVGALAALRQMYQSLLGAAVPISYGLDLPRIPANDNEAEALAA